MKKAFALISAAILIFTVAGCANKQPEPEESTAEQTESTTVKEKSTSEASSSEEKESSSTEEPTSPTAVVIVTGGKEYGIQQPDVTSIMEIVTTIAPPKPRPTVPSRPTAVKQTTAKPVSTARPTTTAKPHTTHTDAPQQTTKKPTEENVAEPALVYGSGFSVGEGEKRDTVKIISHTCTLRENNTFGIMLMVKSEEYSGTRDTMFIGYNCYDKSGKPINEAPLKCLIVLNSEGKTIISSAVAPAETAKIEFVNL